MHGTLAAVEPEIAGVRSWAVTMGYAPQGQTAVIIDADASSGEGQHDIEIALPVEDSARARSDDLVQVRRLDAADAAVVTIHGPWMLTDVAEPVERLRAWLRDNNLTPGREIRIVELTDPLAVAADEQRHELQMVIDRRPLTSGATEPPPPPRRAESEAPYHTPAANPERMAVQPNSRDAGTQSPRPAEAPAEGRDVTGGPGAREWSGAEPVRPREAGAQRWLAPALIGGGLALVAAAAALVLRRRRQRREVGVAERARELGARLAEKMR
ncbi:MAG: hypothetical protein U0531_09810 [Dehalococcoidia bacterium]